MLPTVIVFFFLLAATLVLVEGTSDHPDRYRRWHSAPSLEQTRDIPVDQYDLGRARSLSPSHGRRRSLYPSEFHILPEIFDIHDAETLIDTINDAAHRLDQHLERIAMQTAAPTFDNTIVAVQAPLYELQQLKYVMDYYRYVHHYRIQSHRNIHVHGLVHRVRIVAQNDDGSDVQRCALIEATLSRLQQFALDPEVSRQLQYLEKDIKYVKRSIRHWMRTHDHDSLPTQDLMDQMTTLMELRHDGRRLTSASDRGEEITQHLSDIVQTFQVPAEIENATGISLRSPEDWARAQTIIQKEKTEAISQAIFDLDRVLWDGLLGLLTDLYGYTWEKQSADVDSTLHIFHVYDLTKSKIGTLIFDLFQSPDQLDTSPRTLVLVEPNQYVHVRDHVVLVLMKELSWADSERTVQMTFEQVSNLFNEFGRALHHLIRACSLPGIAMEAAREISTIAAHVHEHLAADPIVLGRIHPDLTPEQMTQIRLEISLARGVAATQILARAVLAQSWAYPQTLVVPSSASSQDLQAAPITLNELIHGDRLLGQLEFAALPWPDTIEFLLSPESSLYWTEPVADWIASRLLKSASNLIGRQLGDSIQSVISLTSLNAIIERMNELDNANARSLTSRTPSLGSLSPILDHHRFQSHSIQSPLISFRNAVKDRARLAGRKSPTITIGWLRLPLCLGGTP